MARYGRGQPARVLLGDARRTGSVQSRAALAASRPAAGRRLADHGGRVAAFRAVVPRRPAGNRSVRCPNPADGSADRPATATDPLRRYRSAALPAWLWRRLLRPDPAPDVAAADHGWGGIRFR